jgi:diguanylate cyclase (GGDEF)-like protein/PAS domain S-box-containing protein
MSLRSASALFLGSGRAQPMPSLPASAGAPAGRHHHAPPTAQVYECSPTPMLMLDAHGRIVAANAAFGRSTGFGERDLLGHRWHTVLSARHSPGFIDALWAELLQKGRWQGEAWCRRSNGKSYPAWYSANAIPGPHAGPMHYLCVVWDTEELRRGDAHWRHLAHHDALTGIANRLAFTDHLAHCVERARRHGRGFTLMFVDLDHFKWVNDTLGHQVGDHLLVQTAHRLRATVRAEDFVARIGGDEFTILLEDMCQVEDAERMAAKVLAALGEAVDLLGQRVGASASVGIAFFPQHGHDADALMRSADRAMYRAKQAGRRTFVCSTQSVSATL